MPTLKALRGGLNSMFGLEGDSRLSGREVFVGTMALIFALSLVYIFWEQICNSLGGLSETMWTGTPPPSRTASPTVTFAADPDCDDFPDGVAPPSPRTGAYDLFTRTLEKQTDALE